MPSENQTPQEAVSYPNVFAYECENCHALFTENPGRGQCPTCNFPGIRQLEWEPARFCRQFGHIHGDPIRDGWIVPGSSQRTGNRTFVCTQEWSSDMRPFSDRQRHVKKGYYLLDYSHLHKARCTRCGMVREEDCRGMCLRKAGNRRLELRWSALWCVLGQQQRGPRPRQLAARPRSLGAIRDIRSKLHARHPAS